jgi:protein involved in polysaccharide export with SLBB domain
MKSAFFYLTILLLAASTPLRAQVKSDYTISPNDIVVVEVFGEKDLSREFRVTRSGTINYYFLGEVKVAGRTTSDVCKELTEKLNKDYVVDPQVTVDVKDYRVREVFVNGAVARPGSIILTGEQDLDILTAIARAGGTTTRANEDKITFTRPGVMEKKLSLQELKKGSKYNLSLQPGDIIEVAEKLF